MERIGSFYEQGTNKIRPELFNKFAEEVAKSFAFVKKNDKDYGPKEFRNGVTSTQLRRMFDEVKRYETLIHDDNKDSWEKYLPYIKMIKSKVHYAVARAKRRCNERDEKYYDNLSSFISEGIELVNSVEDYHVFVSLFEAVYGFYYENRPDLNN